MVKDEQFTEICGTALSRRLHVILPKDMHTINYNHLRLSQAGKGRQEILLIVALVVRV